MQVSDSEICAALAASGGDPESAAADILASTKSGIPSKGNTANALRKIGKSRPGVKRPEATRADRIVRAMREDSERDRRLSAILGGSPPPPSTEG